MASVLSGKPGSGFSLTELLVSLAILAEISTFAIPKILSSQQNTTYNAIGKEVAGTIAQAMMIYSMKNSISASTSPADLVPYLNYAAVDTQSIIDSEPGGTSVDCSDTAAIECLKLHNGAILWDARTNIDFGGTTSLNAIYMLVDPDARYSGSTTGDGKSLKIYVYTTGRIATWASINAGTVTHEWGNYYVTNPDATRDPSWFSW